MQQLIARYLANGFRDFQGSSVTAKLVVQEGCINDLITEYLKTNQQGIAQLVRKASVQTGGPLTIDIEIKA